MKRILAICFSVTLFSLLTGCAGDRSPAREETRQVGPAWKLSYSKECSAGAAEDCEGLYGFLIQEDGRYLVGPAPEGQRVSGEIKSEELEGLRLALSPITDRIGPEVVFEEECIQIEQRDQQRVSLNLNRRGQELKVLWIDGDSTCFVGLDREGAEKLQTEVEKLVAAYYPQPFPDACLDAAHEVHRTYAPLKSCRADADCTFVDNVYGAIPQGEVQYVATDSCTVVQPLVVANAALLSNRQLELLNLRQKAREVCGERLVRADCTTQGFQAQWASPVCRAGTCSYTQLERNF